MWWWWGLSQQSGCGLNSACNPLCYELRDRKSPRLLEGDYILKSDTLLVQML